MTDGGNKQVDLYQFPGNPNVLAPLPESCSTGIKNAEFITAATPAQAVHDEESPLIYPKPTYLKQKSSNGFGNQDALGSFSIGWAK